MDMKVSPLGVLAHGIRGNDCSQFRRWWSVMVWQTSLYQDAPALSGVVVTLVGVEGHYDVGGGSAQARVGGDSEHDVVVGDCVSHGADDGEGGHAERDAPD
jgi:hypothetical protein